jgi:PHD/YefM family antitoxin component YafN of YafNO toxin-antitoxin module
MDIQTQDVRFVVGNEGKPTAVLVDIALWERILDALEDAEDIILVKETLASIDAVGGNLEKAGFISWKSARAELEHLDANKE